MDNLKKFATEADYSAATLNYPAVSWVVSGDTVHFDKTAPAVPNDKVMFVTNGDGSGGSELVLYNCGSSSAEGSIEGITIDDVEVTPITCVTDSEYDASQVYTVKYDLGEATGVDDWFSGDLGIAGASEAATIDILYPSQITEIYGFPENTKNMVVEAETPPYIEGLMSSFSGDGIYVPDSAVNAYESASEWGDIGDVIHPISEYQGNLPV